MAETNPQSPAPFTADGQPTLQQLVDYFADALTDPARLQRVEATLSNAAARGHVVAEASLPKAAGEDVWKIVGPLVRPILSALLSVLEFADPALDDISKIAVDAVIGARPRRGVVPDDVGARIIERLAPAEAVIGPSIAGAQQYLTTITHLQFEGWLLSFVAEVFGDAAAFVRGSTEQLETIAELRKIAMQVFGGGRITRRVLSPFIDDSIVAPAKRWTSQKYRPSLLPVAGAIEAYLRGDWPIDRLTEESSQQGWSDERLDVLVENARKRIALADLFFEHYRGSRSDADVAIEARGLGYDDATSLRLLAIDDAKRVDAINAPILSEAVTNYLAGDIDEPTMQQWIRAAAPNLTDADRLIATAQARRRLHVARITPGEFRALVKDGIQNVTDYERYLESRGYPPADVTLLGLQLRVELQAIKNVENAKAEQAAERAAAKAQRAQDKADRDAEIAAKKARAQFPPLADYKRGYVHGLIDRAVLAEALTRDGIVQDQDLYLGDADADRADFLDAQAKRDAATKKAAAGGLSIAQLEESVLAGVTTIQDFESTLIKRETDEGDRRILVALLQIRLDNKRKADAQRAEADKRAAVRGTSASDWERAVRLGVRSLDDYSRFLSTIDTPDVSRALLLDVLKKEVTDDAATKAKRDARDAAAAKVGISIAERRRAVIAGVRPREWYAQALPALGWPVDDQLADLDLLDVEIANAAAARAKRDALANADVGATLSLAQLESAFKLGLISQPEFRDALAARGYSSTDVDLVVQLAVGSIPNVRGGVAAEDAATPEQIGKPIPISDLKKAVARGLRSPADYEAELLARGFSEDAAALMRQVLDETITLQRDALQKKAATAISDANPGFTLAELLAAFDAGEIDAATVQQALISAGVAADVALVFSRLVASLRAEG